MTQTGRRYRRLLGVNSELYSLPRRQVLLTLSGVMLGLFLASLDQTIVATAMPSIISDLNGFDRFTWATTAYLVASTAVVPIVGGLTDMYGRKWFLVGGIAVFLLGSISAGFSQSMDQLIVFRAVQGLGGGVMMATSFMTVADLFPPSERGKYMGLLSGVFGLSSIIGPTLGGLVTDSLSWHWVFFINIPIGIPVVILFVLYFPQSQPKQQRRQLDYMGIAALVLSVVPVLLALSWGGVQYDWVSAQVIGFLSFGLAMGVAFVFIESMTTEPIIPLAMFRSRVVSVSLLSVFLTGFSMFGAIIFIPLFFQGVLGTSATSSGSFLTPMMLGAVVASVISGQALSRLGGHYRLQAMLGIAVTGLGIWLMSQMTPATSQGEAVVNIVIMGLGLGVTLPLYTLAVQNTVPPAMLGAATSSVQFFRSIGGVLGLAVLGSVLTNRFSSGLLNSVPSEVREAMPGGQLAELARNPQALLNPENRQALEASLSGPDSGLALQLVALLRDALSNAISNIFLIGLLLLVIAAVATLFMGKVVLHGPPVSEAAPGVGEEK